MKRCEVVMQIIHSFINGKPAPGNHRRIQKLYPATGEIIAEVECADDAMLDEAVRAAKQAQKSWAALTGQDRSRILHKIAAALHEANEELSRLEVMDVGKLYSEAVTGDVPSGADAFEYFANLTATLTGTSHQWADAIGYTRRVPLGVCAGIGAWNYPAQIACWKAAPALATGNAFILKPSEETPLVANRIVEIAHEQGLPDGLFQIIHGDYEIGSAICAHKGIAKISLTGGIDTGKLIMKQSADSLKKVTLELGGKAPLIIFDDCDFEIAVQTAMDANFYTAGEVCSNATRVFIQEGIAPKIIAEMTKRTQQMRIGDPMSEDVQIGAIISASHQQKILDYIAIGKEEGATIATGGNKAHPQGFENGFFIEPTIMTNCTDDMRIVREEIFGPVMSVLTFKTEDEAIARANDTDFGLGAGLITSDLSRAHRVADALEAGNIWINTYNLIPADWPFGGAKQSGFGRESSQFAIEAYTEIKATYIQL
ncbi:MAG: betaine-aldehyde dehydrogenase [Candidatus Puniceispirillaceae bacterium]